jgi:digeranylgeranylglycerophospholipid reductase
MYHSPGRHGVRRTRPAVIVVGGGPVGCHTASLLARCGFRVTVLEEHDTIGTPCHCTGIVTRDLLDVVEVPPELVVNAIERMRLSAPDGAAAEIPSRDIVLDRVGLDRHLARVAARSGADIRTGHRFLGFAPEGKIRVSARGRELRMAADVLVGADGPTSAVARHAGVYGSRELYAGLQVRLEGTYARDLYDVHLVVPRFFGWVVPESGSVARVGVAARAGARRELAALLTRLDAPARILDRQRGLIPIYDPALRLSASIGGMEVRLVGDAATMVKATTGGGLVPGLLGATALCASLSRGSSYARELRPVRRRLRAHLEIRRVLNTFGDDDYARVVRMCGAERAAAVLASGSRDRPLRLLAGLLVADPRLAAFAAAAVVRRGEAAVRSAARPTARELAAAAGRG